MSESHRNAGVGKALFGYLGKIAKEKDCGRLDWSVLKVCHSRLTSPVHFADTFTVECGKPYSGSYDTLAEFAYSLQ